MYICRELMVRLQSGTEVITNNSKCIGPVSQVNSVKAGSGD